MFSLPRASVSPLCARASLSFQRAIPPLAPSRFLPPGTCEEKTAGRVSQRPVESELTPAQIPRASLSPHREVSPVLFSQPDQSPSASVSDLVSFGGSDDELADDSMSLVASDAAELSGSVTDPAPSGFARAQRRQSRMDAELFRVLSKRLMSWVWSGLHQRSPLAAVWMSGFCQGAVRPINNDHRRSSLKFTTSSRDLGAPLTLPASVLPLHPPSLRLTALKKRDMRGCLNWMSQWLHISAHPLPSAGRRSHPVQAMQDHFSARWTLLRFSWTGGFGAPSMAVLQVYQATLLSAVDESEHDPATLRELRSTTDLALRATKTTRPSHRKVYDQRGSARAPPVAHADGDQGRGQASPSLMLQFPPAASLDLRVEGFAERFTEAQKVSQAMRHFLPKRSSPSSCSESPQDCA